MRFSLEPAPFILRAPKDTFVRLRNAVAALVMLGALAVPASPQFRAGPQDMIPEAATPAGNTAHLEVEVVTIEDFGATPSALQVKPGPFILYIRNKTRLQAIELVLDSSKTPAADAAALSASTHLSALKGVRQMGVVVNTPPGVYQVKSKSDGRVLFTITIGMSR
jgi:hypothetical protein